MLGVDRRQFRVDAYESYVAVSANWGVLFEGVLLLRALLFWGLCKGPPIFLELPYQG